MQTIEIDFDVFKKLTFLRETEETTYNDVLRTLLKLPKPQKISSLTHRNLNGWNCKGVLFPEGTDFRATYKGRTYYAKVEDSSLMLDGKNFESPSAAAIHITNNPANGWRFWEAKIPTSSEWKTLEWYRETKWSPLMNNLINIRG